MVGHSRIGEVSRFSLFCDNNGHTLLAGLSPPSVGRAAYPAIYRSTSLRHRWGTARGDLSTGDHLTAAHLQAEWRWLGGGIDSLAGWQFAIRFERDGSSGYEHKRGGDHL